MIKYCNIDEQLNDETIEKFIEFMNNNDNDIHLYISTTGGYNDAFVKLLDIINNDDRIKKVTYNWQVSSKGFELMVKTNPKKRVISDCVWSILHLVRREVDTNHLKNGNQHTEFLLNNLDETNKIQIEWFRKLGISEKLIKKIKKGKDVYLKYEDIIKLNIN